MSENEKTVQPTVILPLDKYEKLIRENEKLNAVTGPLIRAIRDSLYMTDSGGIWLSGDTTVAIFKAVCPDYYDEWLTEAERQRAKNEEERHNAICAMLEVNCGGTN